MRRMIGALIAAILFAGCTPQSISVPPTSTLAPTARPFPGVQVLPVDTLESSFPWQPLDDSARPGVHFIQFNVARAPFNNALVRQAVAFSIDREVIVTMAKKYGASNWTPATTLTPPRTLGRDLYGQVGTGDDPPKAKDLLAEANYTDLATFPAPSLIVASYGDIAPAMRCNLAKAMAKMCGTTTWGYN